MKITFLILLCLLAVGLVVGQPRTARAQVDHYHVESAYYDQTAGVAFTVTITAENATDIQTGDNTTVTLSSTHPSAMVFDTNSDSIFNDTTVEVTNGTATIQARDTDASTTVTITVTDGELKTGTSSAYTINPAAIDHYHVTSVSYTQTAGSPFSVTVAAHDQFQNVVTTDYSTSVTMSSSPDTMDFDSDGDGTYGEDSKTLSGGTFDITTRNTTASTGVTITATDGNTKTGTSSAYTINPAAIDHYHVTSAAYTQTAGSPFSVTVAAHDQFQNVVSTDSSMSVTMTSSFGTMAFDANGDAIYGDNSKTLTSGTFNINARDTTAASGVTITATDGNSKTGTSSAYTVIAGSASYIIISPSTEIITAGSSQAYTAVAYDVGNNNLGDVTSLTGFSIVEPGHGGSWGGSYSNVYTSAKAGLWTVRGSYSTLTDDASLTVNAGSATRLEVTGTATMTAGGTNELTITAKDAYGNAATSYSGPKSLFFTGPETAPDGQIPTVEGVNLISATPVTFTNGASNAGAATFIAYRAQSTTVDVTDGTIGSSGSTAYDLDLTVNPASASRLEVTGTAAMTAGTTNELTITAKDSYGNVAASYTGSKSLTFSGPGNAPGGQVPTVEGIAVGSSTAVAFTNGISNAGAATLLAYRAQSTTVDVSDGSIGSSGSTDYDLDLTVSPGAVASLAFTPAGGAAVAGVSFSITVTAHDPYGNEATGYLGTVRFTSTDGSANLPSDYTFISGNNGLHAFSVSLLTAGSQSVTVTDTVTAALTDTETWSVNPSSSVAHIAIAPASATITAGATQVYSAQAYDGFNNPVGDVTSQTDFSVSALAGGSWAAGVYTSEKAGTWTVTGVYAGHPANASLTVTAGEAHHIVISPPTATMTAGNTQAYTAEAFDQFDNTKGDVTSSTTFSIAGAHGGSWTGNTYTSAKAGTWTVTGTYTTLSDTAILVVNPGAIHHYNVSSSSYSQRVGVAFTVTVIAYDAFDNVVSDSATTVIMSSDSDYVSFDGNGDGIFDDSVWTLANGTFTIAAKCSGAISAMSIFATSDAVSGTSPAYTVTIDPSQATPVAADDSYSVPQDTTLMIAARGVLYNDTAAEGDSLAAILVTSVGHGTLRLKPDGSFTYTPDSDFSGTDSFTYKVVGVVGGAAESNIATVTISIGGVSQKVGVSPWIWAGPVTAFGVLGGALLLCWYWRRHRERTAASAAFGTGIGWDNKPEKKPVETLEKTPELDSVTALKAKMARLNPKEGNSGDGGTRIGRQP